ncbi:MAG: tail fiber domain-containing protein, partial [Ferruginibacter sp.]
AIQSPLQKLMLLNGVEYEMKKEAFPKNNFMPGRQIGLLAQNVEQVFPEAVSENADGYKGVDYARLVPLLIESIKELSKQNADLQKRVELMEKRKGE